MVYPLRNNQRDKLMRTCNGCTYNQITWCEQGRFNGKNIDQQKPITGRCESFERIKIIKVE